MTTLRPRQPAVQTPANERDFSRLQNDHNSSGAHPASNSMGTGIVPKVKKPGRQLNDSPPSSTKVKNEWSYTPFFLSYSDIFYALSIGAENYCCTSTHDTR